MKNSSSRKTKGRLFRNCDLPAVGLGAFEGFGVRDEVFEKEGSDGHDAAEGVQTAQQKRGSLASAQRSYARFDFGRRLGLAS